MRRPSTSLLIVLGIVAATLPGCREAKRRAAEEALRKSGADGTLRFLDEAGRERYDPPKDGRVSPSQVAMYLGIQRAMVTRLRDGAAAPQAENSPLDTGLDEKLARESGANPEEYLWVRGRILDARLARSQRSLHAPLAALLEKSRAELEKSRAVAADDRTRAVVEEQLRAVEAEIERERKREKPKEEPSTTANLALLEPHLAELDAIGEELRRLRPVGSLVKGGAPPPAAVVPRPPATSSSAVP